MEHDSEKKIILVYTLAWGLGDFVVMGDLIHKVEQLSPNVICVAVHSNNPFIPYWKYLNRSEKFFNIKALPEMLKFNGILRRYRKEGYTILGIQQAPGSLRGFNFLKLLKRLNLINYIVDFNLYDADIITQPRGGYILDWHLNQAADLLKTNVPKEFYHLTLPVEHPKAKGTSEKIRIGIHPWTRRNQYSSFVWPNPKWSELILSILKNKQCEVVIFGRDNRFEEFKNHLLKEAGEGTLQSVSFVPSKSIQELIQTIDGCSLLITVNTSVVHIGYAFNKKMVILSGPNLDFWHPKGENIITLHDQNAEFPCGDKPMKDTRFPTVARIELGQVLDAAKALLEK